ncbi:MAG: hypothetical protein JWO46_459 [Nocardioidaceae bacterium]|nr:hypothetical protein [Nocardioidaceae bacterium]
MTTVDAYAPAPVTRPRAARAWIARHPVAPLAAVMAVLYAVTSLQRFATYKSAGYDLGLIDQVVTNYARFRPPYAPIAGPHVNMLGDHFSPMLAMFAPLYWVWADPRMLLLGQAALVAISVFPVHRFARRRLGDRTALWIAGGYALGWPLQALVSYDVHDVAFAVPLIAFAVDALDRRADGTLILTCLGLVLVKEDMGLVVLVLGLVRLFGHRPRRAGFAVIAIGVVGYLVATAVVIPMLSSHGGVTHWSYDALGPDLPSALASIVLHPLHAAGLFLWSPPVKSATLVVLLLPVLGLCLRSPYVLAALPLLAERFFSETHTLWGPFFHYSATVWPILVLAAVDCAARLRDRGHVSMPRLLAGSVTGFAVVGTALAGTLFPMHALLVPSSYDTGAVADHAAVVAAIPASTCVEADDRLVPHLTHTNLVSDPGKLGRAPDFVALDLARSDSGTSSPSTRAVRAAVERDGYEQVMRRGDVVLYRSPDYAGPSVGCRP